MGEDPPRWTHPDVPSSRRHDDGGRTANACGADLQVCRTAK